MAIHTVDGLTGWESPYVTTRAGSAGAPLFDGRRARSGRAYYKGYRTSGTTQPNGPTFQNWAALDNATSPNMTNPSGSIMHARTRFYFRARTLPASNSFGLFMLGGSNAGNILTNGLILRTDGKLRPWAFAFSGSGHEGSDSTLTVGTGSEDWYTVDLCMAIFGISTNNKSGVATRAVITKPDLSTETLDYEQLNKNLGAPTSTSVWTEARLFSPPHSSYGGNFSCGAFEIDCDDWYVRLASDVLTGTGFLGIDSGTPSGGADGDLWVQQDTAATIVWKKTAGVWSADHTHDFAPQTRVAFCQMTGAGSSSGWTGAHERALKNVWFAGETSQTAGSAGLVTSFTHQALEDITGQAGCTVGAVHLYAQVASLASVNFQKFTVGGSVRNGLGSSNNALNGGGSTISALSHHCEHGELDESTFDAQQWGVESMHASSSTLYGIFAEVLHDGPAHSVFEQSDDGYQHKWIEWTGTGADRNTAPSTLAGFRPNLILAFPIAQTVEPFFTSEDMPGAWGLHAGIEKGDFVEQRTATGFVAGKSLNTNAVHYVALCVRDDGNAVSGRSFGALCALGARAVEFGYGTAFAPELTFANVWASGTTRLRYKTPSIPSTTSYGIGDAASSTAITALSSNGVTLGADIASDTVPCFVFAWDVTAATAALLAHGIVTGQATDATVSPGFAVYAAFARGSGAASQDTAMRLNESEFSGTNCQAMRGTAISLANAISAISGTTFTIVGNNVYLDNSPTIDANWFAFLEAGVAEPPRPVVEDDDYETPYETTLTVGLSDGVLANDDDLGFGPLTAVLDTDVTNGTLTLEDDGSFEYIPDAGFAGDDTFTYIAVNVDDLESAAPATVTITVLAADAPVAVPDSYTVVSEALLAPSALEGVLINDDAKLGGALTAVLDTDVSNGTLALAANGSFTYTSDVDFVGTDFFTYHANNAGGGDSNTVTVTIYVTAIAANPVPTTFPEIFARLEIAGSGGGGRFMLAETGLADPIDWHYGYKSPQITALSPIRRELSRDGYRGQSWTITFADTARAWRTRAGMTAIDGSYLASYMVFDNIRREQGVAHRIGAGLVSEHAAPGGFQFSFTVEDILGRTLADWNAEPRIPTKPLTVAEFPGLDPSRDGTFAPLPYGVLSDEDAQFPQGVVPAIFVGTFNLTAIGGVNRVVDAYLLAGCAVQDILNLYYNPPAWKAEEDIVVGDLIHPTEPNGKQYVATVAGTTGTTEPTFPTTPASTVVDGTVTWTENGDWDEDTRRLVPTEAYGTVLICPYKPGWAAATGSANNYVDYNGQRYTPIFIESAFRLADEVREGRITITANLLGIETVGDGTGALISDPEAILKHILINFHYTSPPPTGNWVSDPALDDVDMIDDTSITSATGVADSRMGALSGYVAGIVIGADGQQEKLFDLIAKVLEGSDLDMGANRHGQLMFSREDVNAPATVVFTAHDIEENSLSITAARDLRTNYIEYYYGRRYAEATAPQLTPLAGHPLPVKAVSPYVDWFSGAQIAEDTASQTAIGRVVPRKLENYIIRDADVADNVVEHILARGVGAVGDGPWIVSWVSNWKGVIRNNVWVVELGTVVELQHPEGLAAAGWTEGAPARVRVLSIEIDPIPGRVTLGGRLLEDTGSPGSP